MVSRSIPSTTTKEGLDRKRIQDVHWLSYWWIWGISLEEKNKSTRPHGYEKTNVSWCTWCALFKIHKVSKYISKYEANILLAWFEIKYYCVNAL